MPADNEFHIIQHTGFYNVFCTAGRRAFLCGLKDELNGTAKLIAVCSAVFGSTQQRSGVTVMAAGVANAGHL